MAPVTTERKITATAADGKMTLAELGVFIADAIEAAGAVPVTPVVRTRGLGGIKSISVTVTDDSAGR
jgi:hypothetical protein